MVDLSEVWTMQQRPICSALVDDYIARRRHLNIDRKNVIQMTQMFDDWDKWLIPPQCPPSVGQYSATIANVMPSGESHFFHSGLPLKRSTVKGRRLVVSAWGWWEGKEDGWREGGREERKAKSVGGGEEALSYPGGSVSQYSYILGGWFSAAQEVGNAWVLPLGGKEPCLEWCNCKKSPPARKKKNTTLRQSCSFILSYIFVQKQTRDREHWERGKG